MQNIAMVVAASLFVINPPGITPEIRPGEDPFDTTSFQDAHVLDHSSSVGLQFFETFSDTDTYDYLKYTAPYSRTVFLYIEVPERITYYVNVYVQSKSLTTSLLNYNSATDIGPQHAVFVEQGDTVYYEISCSGECTWNSTLDTNPQMSSPTYVSYEKMYGYDIPHNGSATIYYALDSSCNQYVYGQSYTYAEVINDAIVLWESCGNINFVYDETNKYFTIEISSDVDDLDIAFERQTLTNNYFCTEFVMTNDIYQYDGMAAFINNWDGSPVTIKQAVMGVAVVGFGLSLGLGLNGMELNMYNIMLRPLEPYDYLGEGDIASFIALWGDANGSIN